MSHHTGVCLADLVECHKVEVIERESERVSHHTGVWLIWWNVTKWR